MRASKTKVDDHNASDCLGRTITGAFDGSFLVSFVRPFGLQATMPLSISRDLYLERGRARLVSPGHLPDCPSSSRTSILDDVPSNITISHNMNCRDIDGDLIPQENIYPHPSSGQLFDRSGLSTNGKRVLYKGREIVEDGFGIVKLATMVYREPVAAVTDLDESPPASPAGAVDSVIDLDDLSDVSAPRPESSTLLGRRPATNDTALEELRPEDERHRPVERAEDTLDTEAPVPRGSSH